MLHLAVNTLHHHYKEQPHIAVYGTGSIYYGNHIQHTASAKCKVLNVKTSGTYSYHCA
jgi:hypothetical protein